MPLARTEICVMKCDVDDVFLSMMQSIMQSMNPGEA